MRARVSTRAGIGGAARGVKQRRLTGAQSRTQHAAAVEPAGHGLVNT